MATIKKSEKKLQTGGPVQPKKFAPKGAVKSIKKAFAETPFKGAKKIQEAKVDTTKKYMKTGGSTSKKPIMLAYPKDKDMSSQDSAAFRRGAGGRDGGQGDGYPGISQNPYFQKGKDAIKKVVGTKKAKTGGSFPDLNKDGKITKADILKGRGVIAKKGASVKAKCMSCGGKMK